MTTNYPLNRIKGALLVTLTLLTVFATTTTTTQAENIGYILDAPYGNTHLTDTKWCTEGTKSWTTALKSCNTGGGVIGHFDKTTSSYVMLKLVDDSPTVKRNRYQIFVAENGKKINLYKHTDGQHYLRADGLIHYGIIRAEPNSDPDYKTLWTGSFASQQYQIESTGSYQTVSTWKGYVIGNDIYSAQVSAVNVDYSSTWQYAQLNDTVITGVDGGNGGCAIYDIGCHVGAAYRNLTDSLQNLVITIFKGIGALFSPDKDAIKTSMDSYANEFKDKMGFLLYPVDFVSEIYSNLTASQTWCNNTSCSKSFGNLLGAPFSIDFLAFNKVAPQIWEWALIFIRATTVVALMYMIKAKWLKVIET